MQNENGFNPLAAGLVLFHRMKLFLLLPPLDFTDHPDAPRDVAPKDITPMILGMPEIARI